MTPPLPVPLCYSKTFKQMKAALNDAYTVCVLQRKKNIRDWVEMNKKWEQEMGGMICASDG